MQQLKTKISVKPLLRIDEVAEILCCAPVTVRRYVREGKLTRCRPGFITSASLMRYLEIV